MASVTGDPDKAKDRVVTWRAALLGGFITLLVAAVSAGSAILGVIISSQDETERSQLDFLRTQRQGVYAQYLEATDSAERAISDVAGVTTLPTDQQVAAVTEALGKVNVTLSQVLVIGGDQSTDHAFAMRALLLQYAQYSVLGPYCEQSPRPVVPCIPTLPIFEEEFSRASIRFHDEQNFFIDSARRDLGAD